MIRLMKLDDIKQVLEIEQNLFGSGSVENLENVLKNPLYYYWVIEESEVIIGYFAVMVADDDAEIIEIAIRDTFQFKGYGKKLLQYGEEEIKKLGHTGMLLEVRESNTVARKLYEKSGYKPIFVRKKYYSGTEDAIIMKKSFN